MLGLNFVTVVDLRGFSMLSEYEEWHVLHKLISFKLSIIINLV